MKLLELHGKTIITSYSNVQPGMDAYAIGAWERQNLKFDVKNMYDVDYDNMYRYCPGLEGVYIHESIYHWFNPNV